MEILGLVFAGSATDRRPEMRAFVADILGLRAVEHEGEYADMFELPDGGRFAVADEREDRPGTSRTIGFLVADVSAARAELISAGTLVDEPAENEAQRYVHFIAPDGEVYELVEDLRPNPVPGTP